MINILLMGINPSWRRDRYQTRDRNCIPFRGLHSLFVIKNKYEMDKKILVRAAFCTAPEKKDNVARLISSDIYFIHFFVM